MAWLARLGPDLLQCNCSLSYQPTSSPAFSHLLSQKTYDFILLFIVFIYVWYCGNAVPLEARRPRILWRN